MRIAILGLGFMGSTHLKAWAGVPGAELAAVSSGDEQKLSGDLSGVSGNLGGPGERHDFSNLARYRSWREALSDRNVEAVDICLPTHLHAEAAVAALQAGKHVLVEKPIALSGEVADEMIALAHSQKKTLMAAQVLRFIPAYRALIGAVESGRFGAVRSALFRRRCAAPTWNQWLGDPAKSGGGVFDLLIHDVDMCVKLFGLPEAVSATGYENLEGGVDTLTATLHYSDVPSVVITGGWHHKKAYPFSMEFTVVADLGTFEYNSDRGSGVKLYTAQGEAEDFPAPEQDGFGAELQYFHDCCTSGVSPIYCPPEESSAAVKLTLHLLEARKRNGEKIPCQL